MSMAPAAGQGTTMRTGRCGQAALADVPCAWLGNGDSSSNATIRLASRADWLTIAMQSALGEIINFL
jgi:hypothetical protein